MRDIKILFLDFDDVLNTAKNLEKGELFDKKNIRALNCILDRTDVKIVVTSTWRLGATPEELEDILVAAGVHAFGRLVGITPCLHDCSRGAEIGAWLAQAPMPVSNFVILDNRSDMGALQRQLVRTDPCCGLAQREAEHVVGLLGGGVAA